jgi:L-threonylcarbamoyladenylate synthase
MGTRRRRVSVIYFISKLIKWDDLRMGIIANCTQDAIKNAAEALIDGQLVAFPTETVYGLGADANNSKAVARIYEVKGRPTNHPLIVHISSSNQISRWAVDIPDYAITLAREFWPGPVTLILKRSNLAKNFITGGQENVGLRVPSHPGALSLLLEFEALGGSGIAAPSANRFGAVSPTSAEAVKSELGNFMDLHDYILDGGKCIVGIESTIIDCTGSKPKVLRLGAITIEMMEKIIGIVKTSVVETLEIKAPGLMESHYAPKAKIVLSSSAETGDGFLALSKYPTPPGSIRLASPSNLEEFARELFAAFRFADTQGLQKISVVLPTGNGLAAAIRDRILRASRAKIH